jgi:hypothetical protein
MDVVENILAHGTCYTSFIEAILVGKFYNNLEAELIDD